MSSLSQVMDLTLIGSALILSSLITVAGLVLGRMWHIEKRAPEETRQWPPGNAFDTKSIAPRLEKVRADYVAELRVHPNEFAQRRHRLASARREMSNVPDFLTPAPVPEEREAVG